jgi:hypothetical protein
MSAYTYLVRHAPYGFEEPAPLRQMARYDFIDLVRPDSFEHYTVEQRFGVFRWMVATAMKVRATPAETGQWGVSGPITLLSMKPTCIDDCCHGPEPISSLADLKGRFSYALLSAEAGPSAVRWRLESRIAVTERRHLAFPHYTPFAGAPLNGKLVSEHDIEQAVKQLFASRGALTTQLNSCHASAVDIQCVTVRVSPQGFAFTLHYGIEGESCSWTHSLATTPDMWKGQGKDFRFMPYGRRSEPFLGTLGRAIKRMEELTR